MHTGISWNEHWPKVGVGESLAIHAGSLQKLKINDFQVCDFSWHAKVINDNGVS